MRYLYVLCFCLFCCPVLGQQANDIYDLEFRRYLGSDFPWNVISFIAGEGGALGCVDTMEIINGKYPLVFRSVEMLPASRAYYRFHVRLIQQLFIPGDYQQLDFALNTKCLNIKQGWLKVVAFDKQEQCLYRDSVHILNTGEWNECVLKCQGKDAFFFGIEISATGGDDWLQSSIFSIDRMRISGDGRNIDWTKSMPVWADNDLECLGSWPASVLSLVKNKRLVALAETVHGDSLIAASERELIRELVERNQCKLILLELPYDYVLLLNLYIQGNLRIQANELLQYAQVLQFDSDFDMAFLNELRAYNGRTENKVHIVGVDRMTWENRYLFRFWECVSGEKMNTECLAKCLVAGKIDEAIGEFEHDKSLTEGWERINIYWFSRALKQLKRQEKYRDAVQGMVQEREKVMKDNIISVVDSLLPSDKNAVIIGHWLHFNKVNNVAPALEKSCGSYLSQRFGDDYWVVGILKGEGKVWGRIPGASRKALHFLDLPQGGKFLENACDGRGMPVFVGKCRSADRIGWLRCSGGCVARVFYMPVALSQRMDCFLWVK